MKALESPLRPLIEQTLQYQIPLYQRRYAWTQREWTGLWKAVHRQYDFVTQGVVGAPTHFLGSFVFAPVVGMAGNPAKHRVVDGQQRITTLLILLAAMRDVAAESDPDATQRFNDLFLLNRWQNGDDRFKLIPSHNDRSAFFSVITGEGGVSTASGIAAAYTFFRNELMKAKLQGWNFTSLEEVIVDRIFVVEISTTVGDSVHRIFQTLNSSGVALDQVDLLRNHFFMLLPGQGEAAYGDYWRPLEDELGLANLDYFLWADLLCKGHDYENLTRNAVYSAWQQRLEAVEHDEASVVDALRDLLRRGRVYNSVLKPELEPHPEIRRALERAAEWGASIHHPVVLKIMLDRADGRISDAQAIGSLHHLESFLVRRLIAKIPTNNLNRIFATLLAALDDAEATPDVLQKMLSARGYYWPSDNDLRARARSEEFYRSQQGPQRQFVLRRLEEHAANAEVVNWEACDFTVEHVMPQTLTEEWYAYLENAGDEPIKVHAELLHTLGNVTLTCYNPALSNHPMQRKQEIYAESGLRMNKQLADAPQWNRQAILERSDQLADAAIEIWSGPLELDDAAPDESTVTLLSAVASIPPGRWTGYSDLAEVADMPAPQVMAFLRDNAASPGTHRVARSNGEMDVQAPWAAADIQSYMQLLAAEGVLGDTTEGPRLVEDYHLKAEDLAALLGEV